MCNSKCKKKLFKVIPIRSNPNFCVASDSDFCFDQKQIAVLIWVYIETKFNMLVFVK